MIDKDIIFAATRSYYAARNCDELDYGHEECIEGYGGARSELARASARPDPNAIKLSESDIMTSRIQSQPNSLEIDNMENFQNLCQHL